MICGVNSVCSSLAVEGMHSVMLWWQIFTLYTYLSPRSSRATIVTRSSLKKKTWLDFRCTNDYKDNFPASFVIDKTNLLNCEFH